MAGDGTIPSPLRLTSKLVSLSAPPAGGKEKWHILNGRFAPETSDPERGRSVACQSSAGIVPLEE